MFSLNQLQTVRSFLNSKTVVQRGTAFTRVTTEELYNLWLRFAEGAELSRDQFETLVCVMADVKTGTLDREPRESFLGLGLKQPRV